MRRADYPEALMRAAAPALAAIEADARRAPAHLKPLFDAIVRLIFEIDVDLDRIAYAAGFDDREVYPRVFSELREVVGQPAWSYLRDARLETAARLLLETPMSIAEIGRRVGYDSTPSFRHLLRAFLRMPASEYRRQAKRRLERAGPLPEGADTDGYWRRMLAGELTDAESRALDAYLERLAPDTTVTAVATASDDGARWTKLRQTIAQGLADRLDRLPFSEQRRLARAVFFPDGTYFELLSRLSREAADPKRGVELALVAVDSLAANGLLESYPAYASLAWARLARARWLAGDLAGAEEDLGRSDRDVERAGDEDRPAVWEAERSLVAAAFHWLRGRRREALELADHSVEAHRIAGSEDLPKALVLRAELRAAIADREADSADRDALLRQALEDLEEARSPLAGALGDGDRLAAFTLWLRLLALAGDRPAMAAALHQARRAAADLGDAARPFLLAFEGRCRIDPEPPWREARERFSALGDDLGAARAALDLARLGFGRGRRRSASALAAEVATALGPLAAPEDAPALEALARSASPDAELAAGDLDAAERLLAQLEWDRRARRSPELVR